MRIKKNMDPKKIFGPKKLKVEKYFMLKDVFFPKDLGPKFWVRSIFGQEKKFGFKNFRSKKNSCPKNFFF